MIEDFEVSIFLTETSTRHSIIFKQKYFRDTSKKALQSNSNKLTGQTNDAPIEVADGPAAIIREESEESISFQDLPEAGDDSDLFISEDEGPRGSKHSRDDSMDSDFGPRAKRQKDEEIPEEEDDKKKMAMETSYDGFGVNARVLCLVVKRKDKKGKSPAVNGGQAMLEDWITSTQMPPQLDDA